MLPEDRDPFTERIIACAMEVHTQLGPGLLESAYTAALCVELGLSGFGVEREKSFPVLYRGLKLGDYRPDLIVDGRVILEVKSVAKYDPVFKAQMLTYLRITGIKVGLILNFNRPTLAEGIKRVSL